MLGFEQLSSRELMANNVLGQVLTMLPPHGLQKPLVQLTQNPPAPVAIGAANGGIWKTTNFDTAHLDGAQNMMEEEGIFYFIHAEKNQDIEV